MASPADPPSPAADLAAVGALLAAQSVHGLAWVDAAGTLRHTNPAFDVLWPQAREPGQLPALLPRLPAEPAIDFDHPGPPPHRLRLQATPAPAAGGWVLTLTDVSAEHAAATERKRLAEVVEMAQEVGRLGVWERDPRTHEGRWDHNVYRFWGIPPDQRPLGLEEALAYIHPEDRVSEALRDSMKQSGTYAHRFRVLRRDGTARLLHSQWRVENGPDGRPERVIGIMMDDTEVFELARAATDAHKQLNMAVDLARLAIWRHDLQSGRMVYNERAWEVVALPPRAEGLHIDEVRALIHPDDLPGVTASAERALTSDRPTDMQARYRRSDGSWRDVLTRRVVQRDVNGQPVAFLGVALDITEQVQEQRESAVLAARLQASQSEQRAALQALRDAHERGAQAKAMARRESEAKSQFMARMSHELRTPLNAVLGFTQLLLADAGRVDAATLQLRLGHIRAAGQHLLSLINDVLELSSLDSGELTLNSQPVPLPALVEGTLPLVESLAAQHGVQLLLGPLAGTAQADPTRLRQVLLNLLSNAIKYNRAGGRVRVGAGLVPGADGRPEVELEVADTGRGIDDAQRALVFEPFNRLGLEREGIEGTGIGLAIVKALSERMGGHVQLDSRVGEGSVFVVRLPAALDASEATSPTAPAAPPPAPRPPAPSPLAAGRATRQGRLLYIEDNPVNVLLVRELIALRPALTLQVAIDGASGVELARTLLPDLVLVDMQLPDFDGHEVLRRLRADPATAALPCVALSANAMPDDIERALHAGFADYWTKPLDLKGFMDALDARFALP
jgi:hypothetical protein